MRNVNEKQEKVIKRIMEELPEGEINAGDRERLEYLFDNLDVDFDKKSDEFFSIIERNDANKETGKYFFEFMSTILNSNSEYLFKTIFNIETYYKLAAIYNRYIPSDLGRNQK